MSASGWTAAARPTEPARSSSTGRLLLAFALCGLLLAGATVATGAALLYGSGALSVEVEEKGGGDSVRLSLPGGVVLALARLVPGPALSGIPDEARRALPALASVCRELERVPDAVFLSVESPGERVSVEKRAGELLIHADTAEERVRVAIPLRALSRIARAADKRGGGPPEPPDP